jgi:hypothetical protein
MKQFTKTVLLLFAGSLLFLAGTEAARAQRFPRPLREQPYFISGTIRWKKDMGIIPAGPAVQQAAASPCGQFFVAATDPGSGKGIAYSSGMTQQPDEGDYHVCSYSFRAPSNRSLYMIAGMGGVLLLPQMDESAYYWTGPWIGGSRNRPPGGALRGFTGYKYITLGGLRRRGVANFELLYVRRDDPH